MLPLTQSTRDADAGTSVQPRFGWIDSAARERQLQVECEYLRSLLELSNAVVPARDLAPLLTEIAPHLQGVVSHDAASIFLLRQYFLTIPRDLEEAAKLDGAGFFRTFWKVMLPLAGPALAAVAILQFQGTWNNFFWPLVILQQRDFWTLPLGITLFKTQYFTIWPDLMAVVVMATIPIVILYLFFQRYFVEGVAASGVKG